ncbi:MAG: phosphatidate cytidylyltransferase [Gammaproteobacteria bacterium]
MSGAPAPGRYSGLRQRVLTAVVLIAALGVVLFALPPAATLALVVVAMSVGGWEWSAFVAAERPAVRVAFVALVLLGILAAWPMSGSRSGMSALLVVTGLWWLLAVAWILRGPQRVGAALAAVAGLAALVPAAVALGRLRLEPVQGAWVLLFALLVVMAADVGGYFAGHRFGRIKLAPSVSPGKTWEGVLGGLLCSLIVATLGARLLGWPVAVVAPLAVGAAAFSVVGDLMESLMKRHSGLKDSGHLFPGHGGILDRVDSLTAGIPLFTLGLLQAGLVGEGWSP